MSEEKNNEPNSVDGEKIDNQKVTNLVGGELVEKEDKIDVSQLEKPETSAAIKRHSEISDKLKTSLRSLSSADLATRDKVIDHVGRALTDIDKIEKAPQLNAVELDSTFEQAAPKLQSFIDELVSSKSLHKEILASFVGDLIDATGPNRDTTQLFQNIEYGGANYLTNHTLNVVILTISLGIELSKLMEKKLTDPAISGDLKKVLICSRKIFTRENLIDLGIAALLHDIQYRISFPDLHKDRTFTFKEESLIERHSSESFHFLKQHFPTLDYEILRAVYQHHEFMDGSGTPNGVSGRMIARYSPVLSFADYFILSVTENPFHKMTHPLTALKRMMTIDRAKFDDDVLLSFIKGAGFYPIGSWYILSNATIGVVVRSHPEDVKKPLIHSVVNAKMQPVPIQEIDMRSENIQIMAPASILKLKKLVPNFRELVVKAIS